MRVKITRGSDIRGGLNYDLNVGSKRVNGKVAELIGGNMTGSTVNELTSEFESIGRIRPDIEKPVWKEALRSTKGEGISAEKWLEIAIDHMREIGLNPDKHPFIVTQHVGEDHVHIFALRIALDGTVYHGKNENLIASRDCQRLEKNYDLVLTSSAKYTVDKDGRHHIVMPDRTKPRAREITMMKRTGKKSPRQRLQEIITVSLLDRPTQAEYERRLTKAGVVHKLSSNGYSYRLDGIPFKGSQLGSLYKWSQLRKSFTTPEQIQQQSIRAARAAAWEAENKRRSRFRANRMIIHSSGQLAASILPRPLGEAVQVAAETLIIISKINDWAQAHAYRKQVNKLTAQMNQLKTNRLAAEKAKVAQVEPIVSEVRSTERTTEALAPVVKTNPHIQKPVFASPQIVPIIQSSVQPMTDHDLRRIHAINLEVGTLYKLYNASSISETSFDEYFNRHEVELKLIINKYRGSGYQIGIEDRPCPIQIDCTDITAIIAKLPQEPQQSKPTLNPRGGRK